MRYKTSKIRSVGDLLSKLSNRPEDGLPKWFRGQASEWPLRPSLCRDQGGVYRESVIIKGFRQSAHILLKGENPDPWQWLYIMQHYFAPTRLLDWTESPLVALYFAVAEEKHADKNGELWVLLPSMLNAESGIDPEIKGDIPGFGDDDVLDSYLPTALAQERTSQLEPVAGLAPRNTDRMHAQLGTFTIHHRKHTPIENVGNGKHVWKYTIEPSAKVKISEELKVLSINKLALFPELSGSVPPVVENEVGAVSGVNSKPPRSGLTRRTTPTCKNLP